MEHCSMKSNSVKRHSMKSDSVKRHSVKWHSTKSLKNLRRSTKETYRLSEFRPSPKIDGFEPRHFQVGRQTNFFGQNSPNGFVGENPFVQQTFIDQPLSRPFGQNVSSVGSFVEQNSPPVANFFGHNSPTGSNPISQISPAPTVFGQTSPKTLLLTGPSVQPFHPTTPIGQIDRLPFDQNKARHAPQSFRESRHILFNGHGFEDENEEDEIDRPSERIFRGWELDPHEFPWMVKLMVRTALSAIKH